jgi:hypothetical protein
MSNITYFDLDAVVPDQVIVKLKGVEHPLKPVSVDDFVQNTKMLQAIEGDGAEDFEATMAHTKDLLSRAFPTMTPAIIGSMSMLQMNKLIEFAHGINGQKAAEVSAAAVAAENPPKAG